MNLTGQAKHAILRLRQLRHNTKTTSSTLFECITREVDRLEDAQTETAVLSVTEKLWNMSTWESMKAIADDLLEVRAELLRLVYMKTYFA